MSDTPDEERTSWWPPSWFVAVSVAAFSLVSISGIVTWYEVSDARRDARRACERTVGFRDDTRAMWVELFDTFPDSPAEPALRRALNERLPVLKCVDDVAVPVS